MIEKAVQALSEGRIVAYPTETFYGLGVDAHDPEALGCLAALKGRADKNPFPVLVPDVEFLKKHTTRIPESAQRLIGKYWPGPLTIILPARGLPASLMNPSGGVGFRMSSHPIAQEMLRRFGRAVTATSANRSGAAPARSIDDIRAAFPKADIFFMDGGILPDAKPSTVVDFTTSDQPTLVREGAIPWEQLTQFGSSRVSPD